MLGTKDLTKVAMWKPFSPIVVQVVISISLRRASSHLVRRTPSLTFTSRKENDSAHAEKSMYTTTSKCRYTSATCESERGVSGVTYREGPPSSSFSRPFIDAFFVYHASLRQCKWECICASKAGAAPCLFLRRSLSYVFTKCLYAGSAYWQVIYSTRDDREMPCI